MGATARQGGDELAPNQLPGETIKLKATRLDPTVAERTLHPLNRFCDDALRHDMHNIPTRSARHR
jgi:hypothetical protein